MILTEEKAKTKWCPMVRIGSQNRTAGDRPTGRCIGSECMMWVWVSQGSGSDYDLGRCGLTGRLTGGQP